MPGKLPRQSKGIIPLLLLCGYVNPLPLRPSHHAFHISLHTLLVQAIQLEPIRRRGAGRAGAWDPLDGVESMDEHSVCEETTCQFLQWSLIRTRPFEGRTCQRSRTWRKFRLKRLGDEIGRLWYSHEELFMMKVRL